MNPQTSLRSDETLGRRERVLKKTLSRWLSSCLLILALALSASLASCTFSAEKIEFEKAEKASQLGHQEDAIEHYKNVVDRYVKTPLALKSAQEAARISNYDLKRFKDAVGYYKHIVLYSPNQNDRIEAQKKIADVLFNQTLDYEQAIIEYNRLIDLPHTLEEDLTYRLAMARSYFYLNNFYQAQVELDRILSANHDKKALFDVLLLKANILLTMKNLDEAIVVLRQLMEKYPERAKTETIGLVLAVTYEEQKNFSKAIETLESIKDIYPRRSFIEKRIKALKERQSYLPGAKGLRK